MASPPRLTPSPPPCLGPHLRPFLSRLPHEQPPAFPSLVAKQYFHPIASNRHLNVLEIASVPPPSIASDPKALAAYDRERNRDAIIVCHGYGMGIGFYWLNFDEIGKIGGKPLPLTPVVGEVGKVVNAGRAEGL